MSSDPRLIIAGLLRITCSNISFTIIPVRKQKPRNMNRSPVTMVTESCSDFTETSVSAQNVTLKLPFSSPKRPMMSTLSPCFKSRFALINCSLLVMSSIMYDAIQALLSISVYLCMVMLSHANPIWWLNYCHLTCGVLTHQHTRMIAHRDSNIA